MSSFYLAFGLHVNAVVEQEKRRDAIVFSLFGRFPRAVDRRKQFEYAGRSLNLLLVLFACRRRCTPTLKDPFLKRSLCLLSKSQKMNQRQFSFWKLYWEACSQNRPFIARYFHLPCSTQKHLSNKNPAYGPFKMHHCIAGFWKGDSRDPQFGQNIVRDLRNVNVKRNFTATGLETWLRKFGQGCEM